MNTVKWIAIALTLMWFCTGLAIETAYFSAGIAVSAIATLFCWYSEKHAWFLGSIMALGGGAIAIFAFQHAHEEPFLVLIGVPTAGFMAVMGYGLSMFGED